jgi:hypothetical protein
MHLASGYDGIGIISPANEKLLWAEQRGFLRFLGRGLKINAIFDQSNFWSDAGLWY